MLCSYQTLNVFTNPVALKFSDPDPNPETPLAPADASSLHRSTSFSPGQGQPELALEDSAASPLFERCLLQPPSPAIGSHPREAPTQWDSPPLRDAKGRSAVAVAELPCNSPIQRFLTDQQASLAHEQQYIMQHAASDEAYSRHHQQQSNLQHHGASSFQLQPHNQPYYQQPSPPPPQQQQGNGSTGWSDAPWTFPLPVDHTPASPEHPSSAPRQRSDPGHQQPPSPGAHTIWTQLPPGANDPSLAVNNSALPAGAVYAAPRKRATDGGAAPAAGNGQLAAARPPKPPTQAGGAAAARASVQGAVDYSQSLTAAQDRCRRSEAEFLMITGRSIVFNLLRLLPRIMQSERKLWYTSDMRDALCVATNATHNACFRLLLLSNSII